MRRKLKDKIISICIGVEVGIAAHFINASPKYSVGWILLLSGLLCFFLFIWGDEHD